MREFLIRMLGGIPPKKQYEAVQKLRAELNECKRKLQEANALIGAHRVTRTYARR